MKLEREIQKMIKVFKKITLIHLLFVFVFLLSIFLRFYKLGSIPDGFYVDESAIGYNAYSILKTGRDEWGKFLPLYFKSFGDYKLPLYFYLTAPFVALFDLNEFSVRFLSALAGCLTVLCVMFWAQDVGKKWWKKQADWLGVIAGIFLAFEPWHLHFSRISLEANLSLFFVTLGFYLLSKKKKWAYFFLGLSFFTYLAPRLFVPLLALTLVLVNFKNKYLRKKYLFILIVFFFLYFSLFLNLNSLSRVKGIGLFHSFARQQIETTVYEKILEHQSPMPVLWRLIHNKPIEYCLRFSQQYLSHFSPEFLFFEGEAFNLRFSIPYMGNLLLFELPFFLMGFYFLIKEREYFYPFWFLLAPLPSALSFQGPSSVRSIFCLVAFEIISAVGLMRLFDYLEKRGKVKIAVFITLTAFFIFNTAYFLDNYFIHQLVHRPYYWNYGFKEATKIVKAMEKDYQKIVIGAEGSPYIHFLFFNQLEPEFVWENVEYYPIDKFGFHLPVRIGKYFFDPTCPTENIDGNENKVLFVCDGKTLYDPSQYRMIDKIDYKDGEPHLIIFGTRNFGNQ